MISIIIPTYHSKERLIRNLKHNFQFIHPDDEVIIVNDYPQENIEKDLQQFQNIVYIQHKKNTGFGGAINDGVAQAKGDFILLLNDDVLLLDGSYQKALPYFTKDSNLFAVSFAQSDTSRRRFGKNTLFWRRGLPYHRGRDSHNSGINGWAEGGSALFSRQKWDILGGFSLLYSPFYWEDIDLSFRAWKKGYSVLFASDIVVDHHHESTIGTYFQKRNIEIISFRNQFIFTWKNISDTSYILSYFFFFFYNFFYYTIIKQKIEFFIGFLQASQRLLTYGLAFQKQTNIVSDHTVFQKLNEALHQK